MLDKYNESNSSMTPKQLIVSSPAKLNLSFDITGRDANGYHKLITLFQAISLEDKISFVVTGES
jgi:4-diphosphocytidyl-2C-methyl-D-erythritol kinase